MALGLQILRAVRTSFPADLPPPPAGRPDAPAPAGSPRRLLILDDDRDILLGTSRFFAGRGFTVDCACDRAAAETLALHYQYACAIVDVALDIPHGTDGLEIIPFLREHTPLTRILVVTGNGVPSLQDAVLRQGADAFLSKPQRLTEVARVIEGLVSMPPR